MSHADKRTPHTDALETLGMIHFKPEKRDAIHLAVEPVVAGDYLVPGQKIGIIDGVAWPVGQIISDSADTFTVPYHGIVDPFIPIRKMDDNFPYGVLPGESFWFIMAPRMVTSLRHVWEHPEFPEEE